MRRFKKILKWIASILLVLIAGVTVVVMARQNLKYDAPYPNIHASADSAVIARGKHLIFSSAHCINCHNRNNPDSLVALGQEVPLSGGVLFDVGIAKIYSKNITPDKETGIGKYTDAEIARVLRYGVHPNGAAVLDFMPFHNTSDEDLTAIISYLRAQKPVRNEIPENSFTVMGKVVKAFLVKPVGPDGEVPKAVKPDTTAAYGKYLAVSVAECNGCHTKRDMAGHIQVNHLPAVMRSKDSSLPILLLIPAEEFITGASKILSTVFVWANYILTARCHGIHSRE